MGEGALGMMTEPLCYRKRCLIVGSAPALEIPDLDYGCVIGANGGAAIAASHGLDVDCLVTTSYLFRGEDISDPESRTIELLRGLTVQHIWVDTKSGPLEWATDALADLSVSWQEAYAVDADARNEVVRESSGKELWVSSGIWAACLALASGAAHVYLSGISLQNGHYGMTDSAIRNHVAQDRICLDIFRQSAEATW